MPQNNKPIAPFFKALAKPFTASLTGRVLVFASIWALVAFAVVAIVISTLYRASSERAFADLLRAHLNTIIEAIDIDENGQFTGNPQLGSLYFSQPNSGWVWIVDPITQLPNASRLSSPSVGNQEFDIPNISDIAFDRRYIRSYGVFDAFQNHIYMTETEVELSEAGQAVRIRIGGNLNVLEEDVSSFSRSLFIGLFVTALGTLLINALAILYGLRPLDHIRSSLENIRNGNADTLDGEFPREIKPLTNEVNALIESNQRIIERSRKQVGNLAHSLKTPIAVILNEARALPDQQSVLIKDQLGNMQNQVQAYLDRARISAQRGSVLARTDISQTLERLVRVMQKLNPQLDFELKISNNIPILALETHDFEEILGNLIENATRFANQTIRVNVTKMSASKHMVTIEVEDDGCGLSDEAKKEAMKRGKRLDETRPGSGLGLSIVGEIASEYDGRFTLADSQLGGLSAKLELPVVQ